MERSDWLTRLDVVFASLYLGALAQAPPKCWQVLFDARNDTRLARIQFALAGMNAHIDHDLPLAVCSVCREFGIVPVHQSPQYRDYSQVDDLLDGIVEEAKKELMVGLLGDALPRSSGGKSDGRLGTAGDARSGLDQRGAALACAERAGSGGSAYGCARRYDGAGGAGLAGSGGNLALP